MIAALAIPVRAVSTAKESGGEMADASNPPSASFQDALEAVSHVEARQQNEQQPKSKPEHRERSNAQAENQAQPLQQQPSASTLPVALSIPIPPRPVQREAQHGQFDVTASSTAESQGAHPRALSGAAAQAGNGAQALVSQGVPARSGQPEFSQPMPIAEAKADPATASNVPAAASSQPASAMDAGSASKASADRPIAIPCAPLLPSDPSQDCKAQEPLPDPTSPQSTPSQTSQSSFGNMPASAIALSGQMALLGAADAGRMQNAGKAPVAANAQAGADRNASHLSDADARSVESAQAQPGHDQANSAAHHSDSGTASQDSSTQQQAAGAQPDLAAIKLAPDASLAVHFNVHAAGSVVPNTPSSPAAANPGVATDRQAAPQQLPPAVPPPVAINTAQLIHTIQDSQMRVGIHSAEFGNISISTTASRDAVSAQISLDHPELAKAIADNIPQIRETLGPSQNLDIRIAMNAQSGSTLNHNSGGSGSNPRDAWQPTGTTRAGPTSASSIPGHSLSVEPRSLLHGNGESSRLDIRI